MQHDAERYLFDIRSACIRIDNYTVGLNFDIYQRADQVERCLEITGEAVHRATKYHPDLVQIFPDAHAIIGMRNILSHEYGEVNDAKVWSTVQERLPELLVRVTKEPRTPKET